MLQAVSWNGDSLKIIDQTRLPETLTYLELSTIEEIFEAIRALKVRGAPAIGIAAAYGLYLGMRDVSGMTPSRFFAVLDEKIEYLGSARPTAVNLLWALQDARAELLAHADDDLERMKHRLLQRAVAVHEDDRQRCRRMAEHGQKILPEHSRILTHCNTGILATGGIGTAFGVFYQAHQDGKKVEVFATETRPLLQGARLTMWELSQAGIPATLICDNMAGALMQAGKVNCVIVGADRIAADGSVANKIGTYGLAVLARHHQVPFYVAAPLSTFDTNTASGADIPIEIRDMEEVRRVFGKCLITLPDSDCWNPAFDVTPPELISGIITEEGVIKPPFAQSIRKLFSSHKTHQN